MEEKTVFAAKNLSVTFTQYSRGLRRKQIHALRDLCLQLREKEILAVVGASGSGKSLLAHGILGILPANAHMEGEMRYMDEALTPQRQKRLRGKEIVLIPQGVGCLDPLMKVGAQIRRGKRDAAAREKSAGALARYGLEKRVDSLYPFALSGGMARRVLISMAILEKPKLVVADEPTPGVDPPAAGRILGHFREIAQEGAGVLFITHDLELALAASDRVAVLYGGVSLEEAPVSDFRRERLRHPYSKALARAMPENAFQSGFPLPLLDPGAPPEGCAFYEVCQKRRPDCRESVPYREFEGGRVRCNHPG